MRDVDVDDETMFANCILLNLSEKKRGEAYKILGVLW